MAFASELAAQCGYSRFDLRYDRRIAGSFRTQSGYRRCRFRLSGAQRQQDRHRVARHMEGEYPAAPINAYEQNEVKAKVDWQLTGKTWLQFLGGWAKREYDNNPQRDSSEPSARLTAYWKATGKTAFSSACMA
jgi:predicted chitinase